jgi:outer membrane receptor protein involved in Fe transport
VLTAPASTPGEFGPEKLTNYEVGLKQYLFDGRLAVEIAAYHIDWNKIQLLAVVNGVAITANGGKAVSDGVEWAATLAPVEGLRLGWSGAYSDAHLTEDAPPAVGGKDGDPLPRAPKFNTTFTADYEWTLADGYDAFAGATLQYNDKQSGNYTTGFSFRQLVLPSYTIMNLRAGVKTDRYTLSAYVNNLGDKTGYVAIGRHNSKAGGAGAPVNAGFIASAIAPRTIGVNVSASF